VKTSTSYDNIKSGKMAPKYGQVCLEIESMDNISSRNLYLTRSKMYVLMDHYQSS